MIGRIPGRRRAGWPLLLLLALAAGCAGPRAGAGIDPAEPAAATAAASAPAAPAGPGDTLLAVFDGGTVTPTEFTLTWRQLMPSERPPGDPLASRREFLVRMVDRKLLAREAGREEFELTAEQKEELERARAQMIQNLLFEQLIAGVPPPGDAELETFRRQRTQLAEIRFVTFPDWQTARSWRMRLSTGTPMSALDQLIRRRGRNAPAADSFRVVAADQIPDTLATVIWSMRPGQVSEIHSFAGQPVLIHLRGYQPHPAAPLGNDLLTLRTEYQRRQYERIRQGMRGELAKTTGRTFVDEGMNALLAGFLKLPPRKDVDSVTGMPVMRPNLPLPVFTAADTGLIVARTNKGELNLVSYLRYWNHVPPYTRPEVRERAVLEATVDRVLLEQELVDMGVARGLDRSPEVVRGLETMREGFALDHYYAKHIESKVEMDEEALARYFASRPGHYDDPEALEARIIVVDRRELADSLLALARGGRAFSDLAKTWSTDAGTAAKGGMTGYVVRGKNVNVGLEDAMFATPIGALGGPEQTPEGWVIWKVEGKRPAKKRTLDEAREWVVRDFRTIEGEKILTAHLAELRRKANVRLHPERVTLELGRGGEWGD